MHTAERHLRTLAAAAGYRSLHALAQACHVDRAGLRLALRGKRVLRNATVARLASALGVGSDLVRRTLEGA